MIYPSLFSLFFKKKPTKRDQALGGWFGRTLKDRRVDMVSFKYHRKPLTDGYFELVEYLSSPINTYTHYVGGGG